MKKSELITALEPVAREAGQAIMEIYHQGLGADIKEDGSPVTLADKAAESIILSALKKLVPDIPVVSEENAASHKIDAPQRFFLVDPLDGTKEFLKADGQGAFTVNIALIENGVSTLGIIFAPALDRMFTGIVGESAKADGSPIQIRVLPKGGPVAVASASHRDATTNEWLNKHEISKTNAIGSSLKFCILAEGKADVYPRFSPTMEWDIAAGDAILTAAGGKVLNDKDERMQYGKPGYRNGNFIAYGAYLCEN